MDGWVWITGASSGIGAALAHRVSAIRGRPVILSGRSGERLETVAARCRNAGVDEEKILLLPFDARDTQQRRDALEELRTRAIAPDTLINNAGVSQRGIASETEFSVDRDILEVNYLAAVDLTKAVLPRMIERGRGCIIAVASVAGLIPTPLRSAYNAAKAAQIAFFTTLANELAGSGVQVVTIIPGFVRTRISENALDCAGDSWGKLDRNQAQGIAPERAAEEILRGIDRGRRVVYTGLSPRLRTALALRFFAPRILDRILQNAEVT